jgi:hypothetical protein
VFEFVSLLLDSALDVQTNDGETALMVAMQVLKRGIRVSIVDLLLNAGADVSLRDRQGRTALMHAALNLCDFPPHTMRGLAGSSINTRDQHGTCALGLFLDRTFFYGAEIMNVLVELGADGQCLTVDEIVQLKSRGINLSTNPVLVE